MAISRHEQITRDTNADKVIYLRNLIAKKSIPSKNQCNDRLKLKIASILSIHSQLKYLSTLFGIC